MDLIRELDKIIHKGTENTTSTQGIHLDELLQDGRRNRSGSHAEMVKPLPEVLLIIISYSLVILFAIFGNTLICHVIYKHKSLHTMTNLFISNLSISDVCITILNIPFNVVRHILDEWPFGEFMCGFVNFILMVGVYVSTFTMAAIAIDRYYVILYPLRPRITLKMGVCIIMLTWLFGSLMSLPFVIYARVELVELFLKSSKRCRVSYPDPADKHEQIITLITVLTQFILPMSIIAVAYGCIARKLWLRPMIGQPNTTQQLSQYKMKQKTVKMLIIIVGIFTLCWLPLNLYHLLTDLHPDTEVFGYNSRVYLICHWLAMSSVCYNPFIYFWFNDYFRAEIHSWFLCFYKRSTRIHPGAVIDGALIRLDRISQRRIPLCSNTSGGVRSSIGKMRSKRLSSEDDQGVTLELDSDLMFLSDNSKKRKEETEENQQALVNEMSDSMLVNS